MSWEFPKTETWNCVRLLVESGFSGAVIWRAAPCTNEGKRVSFSQDTRRGLTSAISSHFWDFRTFSVHLLGLAKSSHHRLLLPRPEHVLVEKKVGQEPCSSCCCCLENHLQLRRCWGCHWAVFCRQKCHRNLQLEMYDLQAKSCFYQSNEPEEADN